MKDKVLSATSLKCFLCGSREAQLITTVDKKPERENNFGIVPEVYQRSIYQCSHCSVYFNRHHYIEEDFYKGHYNQAVYDRKLLEKYSQIMNLPEEQSDNRQRVKRIHAFLKGQGWNPPTVKVLDVGSGLCVFLGVLKELGYRCYCLDPDLDAVQHALNHVQVEGAYQVGIESFRTPERFDLITFNKVLEHVQDPVSILSKTRELLTGRGVVYLELPDGENALKNGGAIEREEFYIEHFTIFDLPSLRFLAAKSGFRELLVGSLHEPSDKYTLYGFLKP